LIVPFIDYYLIFNFFIQTPLWNDNYFLLCLAFFIYPELSRK
jgi:hypothetical protein